MSQPVPKRRKLDSPETDGESNDEGTTAPPPTTPSNCLYFNDGNIVLIAQDTAFRVHKGVLALHSEVFRNMFGDVNQPEDAEVFDGCSVVTLSDEREALETFLKALYMIEYATQNFDRG